MRSSPARQKSRLGPSGKGQVRQDRERIAGAPKRDGGNSRSGPSTARPVGKVVGVRIGQVRQERRLTLDALAVGTGLTPSFLSKLERGQTSISVDNLRSIAHYLGVEMVYFLQDDQQSQAIVTRAGSGTPLRIGDTEAFGESLLTTSRSSLQATLYRTPPGQGRPTGFSHIGQEFVFVLQGAIQYRAGSSEFELSEGDSIWHPSTEPHRWHNHHDAIAVTLHVNTPPFW